MFESLQQVETNVGQWQRVVADGGVAVGVGGGQAVKSRGQVSEDLIAVLHATEVTAVHRRFKVSRQRPDVIVPETQQGG